MTVESVELLENDLATQRPGLAATARRHEASLLRATDVERADLVLAMARPHRRRAVEMVPSRLRATFTVREFARLSAGLESSLVADRLEGIDDPRTRLQSVLGQVSAMRSEIEPPADGAEDDVIDPYRRSTEIYRQMADELAPALGEVVRLVSLAVDPGGPANTQSETGPLPSLP